MGCRKPPVARSLASHASSSSPSVRAGSTCRSPCERRSRSSSSYLSAAARVGKVFAGNGDTLTWNCRLPRLRMPIFRPREVIADSALGIPPLTADPNRLQLASGSCPPNCFRVRRQKCRELLGRVVTLDHAVSCTFIGSLATFAGFSAPSWLTSIRASSFGVSNSGQSSRNSFCSL